MEKTACFSRFPGEWGVYSFSLLYFSMQPKPVHIYIQQSCPGCLATRLGELGKQQGKNQMQQAALICAAFAVMFHSPCGRYGFDFQNKSKSFINVLLGV